MKKQVTYLLLTATAATAAASIGYNSAFLSSTNYNIEVHKGNWNNKNGLLFSYAVTTKDTLVLASDLNFGNNFALWINNQKTNIDQSSFTSFAPVAADNSSLILEVANDNVFIIDKTSTGICIFTIWGDNFNNLKLMQIGATEINKSTLSDNNYDPAKFKIVFTNNKYFLMYYGGVSGSESFVLKSFDLPTKYVADPIVTTIINPKQLTEGILDTPAGISLINIDSDSGYGAANIFLTAKLNNSNASANIYVLKVTDDNHYEISSLKQYQLAISNLQTDFSGEAFVVTMPTRQGGNNAELYYLDKDGLISNLPRLILKSMSVKVPAIESNCVIDKEGNIYYSWDDLESNQLSLVKAWSNNEQYYNNYLIISSGIPNDATNISNFKYSKNSFYMTIDHGLVSDLYYISGLDLEYTSKTALIVLGIILSIIVGGSIIGFIIYYLITRQNNKNQEAKLNNKLDINFNKKKTEVIAKSDQNYKNSK